jgi:hypothetical protein
MPRPSAINGLHLCDAAIHKQFRSLWEMKQAGLPKIPRAVLAPGRAQIAKKRGSS